MTVSISGFGMASWIGTGFAKSRPLWIPSEACASVVVEIEEEEEQEVKCQ